MNKTDKQTLEIILNMGVLSFVGVGVATLVYYKTGFDLYYGRSNIFTKILYKVSVKHKDKNSFDDFINNYKSNKGFLSFLLENKP